MLVTDRYRHYRAHRKGSSLPSWPCVLITWRSFQKRPQLGPHHPPKVLVLLVSGVPMSRKGRELLCRRIIPTTRKTTHRALTFLTISFKVYSDGSSGRGYRRLLFNSFKLLLLPGPACPSPRPLPHLTEPTIPTPHFPSHAQIHEPL